MSYPKRELIEHIRQQFPKGTRVELVHMDDPDPVPSGTLGTVLDVNSLGDIIVDWDNGRSLSVICGQDVCRKIGGTNAGCV